MRKLLLAVSAAIALATGVTGCNAAGIATSAMHPLDNFGGVLRKKASVTPAKPMDNFGGVLKKSSASGTASAAKTLDNFGGVL